MPTLAYRELNDYSRGTCLRYGFRLNDRPVAPDEGESLRQEYDLSAPYTEEVCSGGGATLTFVVLTKEKP